MKLALTFLISSLTAVVAVPPTHAAGATPDEEGLVPLKVRGLDHVYARPGVDLGDYDKIMIDPIEVSFSKDWKPKDNSGFPIKPSEKQEIKQRLAEVLRDEFTKELTSGHYRVVNVAQDNTLRIKPEIRDLYVNAPDVFRPGISRTYTLSTGSLTLVAELRDAPTGALIARVIDHREDPRRPHFQLTTRVENETEARRIAGDWARILRKQLDAAHAIGNKKH